MGQTKTGAIKVAAKKADLSVEEYLNFIANDLKKCTICKRWLTTNNFPKDKSRHDCLSSKCRECSRAIWRIKNITSSNKRIQRRNGDKKQAMARINSDIESGLRPSPNDLFCALCGHLGTDKKHEYHHPSGYSELHHYDVIPLCTTCHHREHQK